MAKKLRYIEISRRNPLSRILIGGTCGDVCINIRRAGSGSKCAPEVSYDNCCQPVSKPLCDLDVATVCALEVDDDGYHVFEWPSNLYTDFKEGWYEGVVSNGCNDCGVFPIRIGPRCNVIEVETSIFGPDSACWVGCDDDCAEETCPTSTTTGTRSAYIPSYEL